MTTELCLVLSTVAFLIVALGTVMGVPLYYFIKEDRKKSQANSSKYSSSNIEAS